MYSGLKYLFYPIIHNQMVNNNRVSGGFPHSEIHGSKLILSSPWLIAEYHVFHRLLLPRHPPNALLALDLIQKKKDLHLPRRISWQAMRPYSEPKVILSRASLVSYRAERHLRTCRWPQAPAITKKAHCMISRSCGLVYLTWTTLFVSAGRHIRGRGNNQCICSPHPHGIGTRLRSSSYLR